MNCMQIPQLTLERLKSESAAAAACKPGTSASRLARMGSTKYLHVSSGATLLGMQHMMEVSAATEGSVTPVTNLAIFWIRCARKSWGRRVMSSSIIGL